MTIQTLDHNNYATPRAAACIVNLQIVQEIDWNARCRATADKYASWDIEADALLSRLHAAWPEGAPESLHLDDFALAVACGAGNERAVAEFIRRYAKVMRDEAAKVDASPTFVGEADAQLRERLLAPREDAPPRVSTYQGRGSLADWVRVAAARNALNLARGRTQRGRVVGGGLEALVGEAAPELRYVTERYRAQVNDAVRFAFGTIETEGRNMLRMHYVDGVGLGDLGALYGVHKSTMSRRVAHARDAVLQAACDHLAETLSAPQEDVAGLLRLLHSQLDVTLSRVLKATRSAP